MEGAGVSDYGVFSLTSANQRFRVSLLRRSQAMTLGSGKSDIAWLTKHMRNNSFSLTYLRSYKSSSANSSFEVDLTKAVLDVARRDGRDSALEVVEQFSAGHRTQFAKCALTSNPPDDPSYTDSLYDQFLFEHTQPEGDGARHRACYDEVLGEIGIRLPLDKTGMLTLLLKVHPTYHYIPTDTFDKLRDFVWDFVSSVWPLFDSSVLYIPLQYFQFTKLIDVSTMRRHLRDMSDYGLERLMGRLIVLRAACGSTEAINVALNHSALEMCQYDEVQIDQFRSFLSGQRVDISRNSIKAIAGINPIERATYLIMYLAQNRTPSEFLQRVIDLYCIDPTVLRLVDWNAFRRRIEDSAELLTPELVAMASILGGDGILDRSPIIKGLYIPTSANIDILNYAKYCREQKRMTAYQFFRSFAGLELNAQRAIFHHLLEPGNMDTIANVFPSETNLLARMPRDDAVNALSLKLDCIAYLQKRGLMKNTFLRSVEDATRQRLRQIKYENDASSGRIRLSATKLRGEISHFIVNHWDSVVQDEHTLTIGEESLRLFLANRRRSQFAKLLTHFICFESRVAFDYLLSNMRHNFLRFKLEGAIDSAFHLHDGADVSALKRAIKPSLDEFCANWLTISPNRSFFNSMTEEFFRLTLEIGDDTSELVGRVAGVATARFEQLLHACKIAWTSQVHDEIALAVSSQLSMSRYEDESSLREAVLGELGRAFADSGGWLTVNNLPFEAKFGLKELFIFEAVNFSSAKTRRRPFQVQCFSGAREKISTRIEEVYVSGNLFDAMVQLVQNLLENAFAHSGLPVANTAIDISIFESREGIRIEFRNKFDPDKRDQMERKLKEFSERIKQAMKNVHDAPLASGGTGLKRIFFELHSVLQATFSMRAENSEFGRDTFLVICTLPGVGVR